MQVIINGEKKDLTPGTTIGDVLKSYALDPNKIVVELNGDIPAREGVLELTLNNNDTVELVRFVGGG